MEITEVLERAKRQLADTTGLKPIAVTRAYKNAEGWHIGLEMLEMARIPTSTDVLGDYDVDLSEDGCVVRFERRRTRLRAEPMAFEEAG